MPGMDGIEVLERIKGDEQLRHLPVIVISGVDDAESVVRCIEMGAEDFLPKPFDPVILRARVNAGLNRKALHDLEQERVRSVFARFVPESVVGALLDRTEGGSHDPRGVAHGDRAVRGPPRVHAVRGVPSGRPGDRGAQPLPEPDDRRGLGQRRHARRLHGRRRDGGVRGAGADAGSRGSGGGGGSLDGRREAPRVQRVARGRPGSATGSGWGSASTPVR